MVVQPEGQVVGDQVFAADTEIKRIEVLEISPHALKSCLGDAGLGDEVVRELGSAEDVVPNLVDHLLRGDIALAPVDQSVRIQTTNNLSWHDLPLLTKEVRVQPRDHGIVTALASDRYLVAG